MKIRLLSDLHLEFSQYRFAHLWTPSEEDKEQTLILAGDIGKGMGGREFIEELCKHFRDVIRICGNHEFYDNDFDAVIKGWTEFEYDGPKNFHFLHNDWRILDGVRFLGGTMWTDFNDGDVIDIGYAHRVMNDYACIKHNDKLITPEFVLKEHDKFMNFLMPKLEEPFDGKTVVISHHSPGNGFRLKRRKDRSDAAYFADLEELIAYHDKVDLWVHGHTHRNWDYMINNTRVVCNPYGYYDDTVNRDFDKNLVIEI